MNDTELLNQAIQSGLGAWAVAPAAVVAGVRVLRAAPIQAAIPPRWRWDSLPWWAQYVVVGVSSVAASVATAVLVGVAPAVALAAAVPVALAAIGGHEVSKAAGYADTAKKLTADPGYVPGAVRKAISPVLPIDSNAIIRAKTDPLGTVFHPPISGNL